MNKKLGMGSVIFGAICFFLGLLRDPLNLDIDSDLTRPLLYIGAAFGITGIVILNKYYQKQEPSALDIAKK